MREPDIISNMKETSTQLSHVEKLKQQQDHSNKNELNGHKTETTTTTAVSTTTTTCLMNGATPATFGDCKLMLKSNINVLKCNNQIKELHTVIRDKETSHSDFKFYSDRLIRLLVEEGLNELPYTSWKVVTSAGCEYEGVKYIKGICGVSIMRSGEAMEKGLRECCRCIRIGKILIQSSDEDHQKSNVIYAKFPSDISCRKILLMYPIMTTGSTVNLAIQCLREHSVTENNIILLCLFATPAALQSVSTKYPDVHILTSEIDPNTPYDFGQRYFGTE